MSGIRASMVAILLLACGAAAGMAQQQRAESEEEKNARLARQGAGLSAGIWQVQDVDREGVDASKWPLLEGYFQRGLDRHLAIESSVSVWRREETETSSSGLGGTTTTTRTSYIIPLLTGIKFYPATTAGDPVEPYIGAALGFALGVEDSEGGGGGVLAGGGGTAVETGFGARGSAGVEFRLTSALGAGASIGYQWLKFGNRVGPIDTYKGLRATAGLTYRFQY